MSFYGVNIKGELKKLNIEVIQGFYTLLDVYKEKLLIYKDNETHINWLQQQIKYTENDLHNIIIIRN